MYVQQAPLDRKSVAEVVTQGNDALEMTVTPVPLPEATSLSGVQPKLSLVQERGRYVARTKDAKGVHIIAKLPTVEYPLLPQTEELSMRMAAACGVDVCHVELAPLENIEDYRVDLFFIRLHEKDLRDSSARYRQWHRALRR